MDIDAFMFLGMKHKKMWLTLDEACGELGIKVGTAHNQICAGTFPIPTTKQGRHRVIDLRDLGDYIDRQRRHAHVAHNS
jgi:predicted site-specific integrase-resolvase